MFKKSNKSGEESSEKVVVQPGERESIFNCLKQGCREVGVGHFSQGTSPTCSQQAKETYSCPVFSIMTSFEMLHEENLRAKGPWKCWVRVCGEERGVRDGGKLVYICQGSLDPKGFMSRDVFFSLFQL